MRFCWQGFAGGGAEYLVIAYLEYGLECWGRVKASLKCYDRILQKLSHLLYEIEQMQTMYPAAPIARFFKTILMSFETLDNEKFPVKI